MARTALQGKTAFQGRAALQGRTALQRRVARLFREGRLLQKGQLFKEGELPPGTMALQEKPSGFGARLAAGRLALPRSLPLALSRT
eukprot:360872-Chlamydomonas_euryale.AAC.1